MLNAEFVGLTIGEPHALVTQRLVVERGLVARFKVGQRKMLGGSLIPAPCDEPVVLINISDAIDTHLVSLM